MVVTKGKRKSAGGESDKPAKVKKLEDDIPDVSLSCVDEIPFPTPNKKGKRKREIEESDKSAEVKKRIVDVSKRRPVIDVVEKIGVGVTAEAQSLFNALSKKFAVSWDKTAIVVMNVVRVSSPYRPENVAGGTQVDNERVRKVVQKELRRLQTR